MVLRNDESIVILINGEDVQIDYVTTEAGVETYRAMNALALKPPGSTTRITQALDRGFFRLFLNILCRNKSKAKYPKYMHMKLSLGSSPTRKRGTKNPKKRKRNADEASLHMADDGKQFQQVMSSSGRIRNVLVQ